MPQTPTPTSIPVSDAEVKSGYLSQRNLEIAVRALYMDGLVVLENLVSDHALDTLEKLMIKDAYDLQGRKDSPYNYNKGNIQQDPLLTPEYFFDDVYLNPIVTQVTSTVLGPKPSLRFISGNTALPPTKEAPPMSQPTHSDADFQHPSHPFALVVNVPLVTMTPENGATEVWLGTHLNTGISDQEGAHGDRASGRIKKTLLDARRSVRPPIQPVVGRGSIIVRDLRLWHGGKPNMAQDPRVMLAMIHFAPWYRNQMEVEFAAELKEKLTPEKTGLDIAARFVPSDELKKSYLNRPYGNAYDFNQAK